MIMTFVQTLTDFFDITNMMPHGYCLIWNSPLLWLHIISDALIAITYYSIPISMLYFIRQHESFPYKKLLLMFVAFIIACGTTHLVSIVTIWIPIYWLEGLLKLLTGLLSLITAIAVIIGTPKILAKIEHNQLLEKELEANKVVLIEAKEKAERFSTLKSQFISTMSHEIRTPMAAIIGFSELAMYEDDTKEIKTYLRDINTASTSLMGILQDILDFTKLGAGRY
jgi:signal transduction histidine kinase